VVEKQISTIKEGLKGLNSSVETVQKDLVGKMTVLSEKTRGDVEKQINVVENQLKNMDSLVDATQRELQGKLVDLNKGVATKKELAGAFQGAEEKFVVLGKSIEETQKNLKETKVNFLMSSSQFKEQIADVEKRGREQFDSLLSTTEALIKREVGDKFLAMERRFNSLNEKLQRVEKMYAGQEVAPAVVAAPSVPIQRVKDGVSEIINKNLLKKLFYEI